jgi:putative membrane protein
MKVKHAGQFFSEEEKEKISAAIKAAETITSGEIATMVVERSDSYREAETLGAILLAGLLAFIVEVLLEYIGVSGGYNDWNTIGFPGTEFLLYGGSIWTFIPMVFLFFLPVLHLFRRYPALKLPLVGKKRIEEAVRERAVRAFFEKRLYKTRDETGILIFISLLERKVWILGDKGIDRKVSHTAWKELVKELSLGIREERACEILCSVISKIGEELERHFPRKADDVNELSDEVLN